MSDDAYANRPRGPIDTFTGATDEQKRCKHDGEIQAQVNVCRLEDTGRFNAEVIIWCGKCQVPFEFMGGMPAGISWDRPMTSITGLELNAPIEPASQVRMRSSGSYTLPPELHGRKH